MILKAAVAFAALVLATSAADAQLAKANIHHNKINVKIGSVNVRAEVPVHAKVGVNAKVHAKVAVRANVHPKMPVRANVHAKAPMRANARANVNPRGRAHGNRPVQHRRQA